MLHLKLFRFLCTLIGHVTVLAAMRIYDYIILYVTRVRFFFRREPSQMLATPSSILFGASVVQHMPQTFLEHVSWGGYFVVVLRDYISAWRILMFRWLVANHIGLWWRPFTIIPFEIERWLFGMLISPCSYQMFGSKEIIGSQGK